jgi:hypothetical protein
MPRSIALLKKQTSYQLVKKFPTYEGPRKLLADFSKTLLLTLPWVRRVQSTSSHPTYVYFSSVLILSSLLLLSLLICPFPYPVRINILPPACHLRRLSHFYWCHYPNNLRIQLREKQLFALPLSCLLYTDWYPDLKFLYTNVTVEKKNANATFVTGFPVFKVPYFCIDNAHQKLFRHSFWFIDNEHEAN